MTDEEMRACMREMGRRGGQIGGKRRRDALTPEERRASAVKAARGRWGEWHGTRPLRDGSEIGPVQK